MIEPGAPSAGPSGRAANARMYRKRNGAKEFVIVDAAMNDLFALPCITRT